MSSIGYRPEVDGLRAVAVGAVVLYHAGVPLIHGGFIGVDIFFVISGYLITAILYREIAEKRFSLVAFYERRVRRLLPALFSMIAATGVAGWFVLLPEDFAMFGQSAVATLLFVANIFFWQQSENYFDAPAHMKPLLHTWSLGVEEQFYIFFPIFLFLVMRFLPRQTLAPLIVASLLISFGLSVWGVANAPVATFYFLPTRAWELLLGAVLALPIVPIIKVAVLREVAAIFGLALIAFGIYFITPETAFPGWAAVPPCVGAALIIHASVGGRTMISRGLSWRPMVFVGLISYSLYLVHWPVFVLAGYVAVDAPDSIDIALCLAASVALAVLLWRYIEQPFRAGGSAGFDRRQIFVGAGVGMLTLGMASIAVVVQDGVQQRMPSDVVRVLDRQQYVGDRRDCHMVLRREGGALCVLGAPDTSPSFMLLGDSHAGAMAPGLFAAAAQAGRAGLQFTEAGYSPIVGYNKWGEVEKFHALNKRLLHLLETRDDISDVFIVVYWHQAIEKNRYWNESGGLIEGARAVPDGLIRLAQAFPDKRFVLVHAPPVGRNFGYHVEARKRLFGAQAEQVVSRTDYTAMRERYERILDEVDTLENVSMIDPVGYLLRIGCLSRGA